MAPAPTRPLTRQAVMAVVVACMHKLPVPLTQACRAEGYTWLSPAPKHRKHVHVGNTGLLLPQQLTRTVLKQPSGSQGGYAWTSSAMCFRCV